MRRPRPARAKSERDDTRGLDDDQRRYAQRSAKRLDSSCTRDGHHPQALLAPLLIEKGKSKLDLDESGHLLGLCLGTLDDYLVVHPEDGHSPAALVAPLAEEDQGELGPRIAVSRISLG